MNERPEFLKRLLGNKVVVKVKEGEKMYARYVGTLKNYDRYLNLVLENSRRIGEKSIRYGTIVIRGSFIISVGKLEEVM